MAAAGTCRPQSVRMTAQPDDVSRDPEWARDQVMLRSGVALPVRATSPSRRRWTELPQTVRAAVTKKVGSEVVRAMSVGTGFTAGFASRLELADGQQVFVKAASAADDRLHGWDISAAYRVEARNLAALSPDCGVIPLLWTLEPHDGQDDWIVLGFPYVAGHPPRRPWRPDELRLVTDRLAEVAPTLATAPPELALEPFVASPAEYQPWIDRVRERDGESTWLRELTTLAREFETWCLGSSVAHLDLRDDNLIIGDDGRVWICDWNWPMLAAPWLDLVTVLLAPFGDGLDVDAVLTEHPLTRDLDGRAVDAWLANLWFYFTTRMEDEVPHSSPHLRDHQAWYADVTEDWLAGRTGVSRDGDRA